MNRKVVPCGMLYSQRREYFLLRPEPIVRDSWQGDNCYRFLVVPRMRTEQQYDAGVYPHSRHIVTNAFVIDYSASMPEIEIEYGGEYDVLNKIEFSPILDDDDYPTRVASEELK